MNRNGDGAGPRQDPYKEVKAYINKIEHYVDDLKKIANRKKPLIDLEAIKRGLADYVLEHSQSKEYRNKLENVIMPTQGMKQSIKAGETDYAYDRIFGGCLEESTTKVIVEEPHMEKEFQVANLVHFVEFVIRANRDGRCNIRSVLLRTCETSEKTEKAFATLKESALRYDIALGKEHVLPTFLAKKKGMHDRHIRFLDDSDYGWSVSLSIGLHIFAWTDYSSVGAYDFSRRVAWNDFELHYHREHFAMRQSGMPPLAATAANRTASDALPPSDSDVSASSHHVSNESPPLVTQRKSKGVDDPFVVILPRVQSIDFTQPPPGFNLESAKSSLVRGTLSPTSVNGSVLNGTVSRKKPTPPLAPDSYAATASKVANAGSSETPHTSSSTARTAMTRGNVSGRHATPHGHAPRTADDQQPVPNSRTTVKTVLCRHYVAKGRCLLNDRCSFAHGEAELFRLAHIDSGYKTKNCRNYHESGHCPRDVWRCNYVHYETPEQLQALRASRSFLEAGIVDRDGRPRMRLSNERDPQLNHRDAKRFK